MKKLLFLGSVAIFAMIFANFSFADEMKNEAPKGVEYLTVKNEKIPVILERDSYIPVAYVRLAFIGGGSLYDEKLSITRVASAMLNEGTKRLGAEKFFEQLDDNAISVSADAGGVMLNFRTEFLVEKQDLALKMLKNLMLDPNFTEKILKKVKNEETNDLIARENNLDFVTNRQLSTALFQNTPFALHSTPETVAAVTLNDVKNRVKNALSLKNLIIIMGGDIDKDAMFAQLSEILSHLKVGKKVEKLFYAANKTPSTLRDFRDTHQAYIYFGAPFFIDKNENFQDLLPKVDVAGFILGESGFGSRMMEEVRVKRGLAYSAYMSLNPNVELPYAKGYLQTKVETEDEAIKIVREVVKNFTQNGVTQDELDAAKNFIIGSKPLAEESMKSRLGAKFGNFYDDLPLDYTTTRLKKIQDLTLDEVNDFIKSHTELNDLTFSVITAKLASDPKATKKQKDKNAKSQSK